MKIEYSSGPKTFTINTPARKAGVRQYARRCYHAVAATAVKSPATSDKVLREVAWVIKKEMKNLASIDSDSILRDSVEAVKHFSWETITSELQNKVPTLMKFLQYLVKKPRESKPFIASLACQLVKDGHPQLGLLQRAVSVLLYANGTSKNVGFHFKPNKFLLQRIFSTCTGLSVLESSQHLHVISRHAKHC